MHNCNVATLYVMKFGSFELHSNRLPFTPIALFGAQTSWDADSAANIFL